MKFKRYVFHEENQEQFYSANIIAMFTQHLTSVYLQLSYPFFNPNETPETNKELFCED